MRLQLRLRGNNHNRNRLYILKLSNHITWLGIKNLIFTCNPSYLLSIVSKSLFNLGHFTLFFSGRPPFPWRRGGGVSFLGCEARGSASCVPIRTLIALSGSSCCILASERVLRA
jgi:hypothetical protein